MAAADQFSLHLLEWSRQGLPCVLLHGFGDHAHVWDALAPELAPFYRTLALDWRGHGDSPWDSEHRYDPDTLVRDLVAVVEALELKRLVLVGHSLGGGVAARFAALHPERTTALVLVDAGPECERDGVDFLRADTDASLRHFSSIDEYLEKITRTRPQADPRWLRHVGRYDLRPARDGGYERKLDPAFRQFLDAAGESEAGLSRPSARPTYTSWDWELLQAIRCPALVVRGMASAMLSQRTAERTAALLSNGRLAVVPRAGHAVMTDNPSGFRAALASFLLGEE